MLYILDELGNPAHIDDSERWANWFETADRIVARDGINGAHISTVFLGVDHAPGHAQPLLFETMIFGGKLDGYEERYATREEALVGHADAVCLVKLSAEYIPATIRKWDFEKHEYETVANKYDARLAFSEFDPEEIISCANCGKEITAGESMVSKQWHNGMGFGYPVCGECHTIEWDKYNSLKDGDRNRR